MRVTSDTIVEMEEIAYKIRRLSLEMITCGLCG
jgi:hypothetical protein